MGAREPVVETGEKGISVVPSAHQAFHLAGWPFLLPRHVHPSLRRLVCPSLCIFYGCEFPEGGATSFWYLRRSYSRWRKTQEFVSLTLPSPLRRPANPTSILWTQPPETRLGNLVGELRCPGLPAPSSSPLPLRNLKEDPGTFPLPHPQGPIKHSGHQTPLSNPWPH